VGTRLSIERPAKVYSSLFKICANEIAHISGASIQLPYPTIRPHGRPGKGNDKGKVEGLVGTPRLNFMVPILNHPSYADLNAYLEKRCRQRPVSLVSQPEALKENQEYTTKIPKRSNKSPFF